MVKTSTFKVTLKRYANGEEEVEMTSGKKTIAYSFGKSERKWKNAFDAVAKIIRKG